MNGKCIICGNSSLEYFDANFAPFLQERMFDNRYQETKLAYCPECGMYYSSYRPTDTEMEKLYKNYRDDHYVEQRHKYEPFYTKEFNDNLTCSKIINDDEMESFLSKYVEKDQIKNVLDYGGDAGQKIPTFFNNSEKFVYDVSCVSPVDGVQSISEDEMQKRQWDFILCSYVLEHLSYPVNIIEKMINMLKDGGYLYIELPNEMQYINTLLNGAEIYIHEHINFFTSKTLNKIFNRYNLLIIANEATTLNTVTLLRLLVKKTTKNNENLILNKLNYIEIINKEIIKQNSEIIKQNKEITDQNEKILFQKPKESFWDKLFSIKKIGNRRILRVLGIKISKKIKS